MRYSKKDFQPTIRLVLLVLFSKLLLNCKNDQQELTSANRGFEVIIKTHTDIDSLSMAPSTVQEKFLDTSYTYLFKGYSKNGSVKFKGKKLPHPYMFDILEEAKGISEIFFVDNGTTEVSLRFENYKGKITIDNNYKSKAQTEYEELKTLGLNEVDSLKEKSKTPDERALVKLKRDSVIVNYIHKNPDSYVPLWLMANYLPFGNNRYNKLYDESLQFFADDIKQTEFFKRFKSALEDSKESIFTKSFSLKNLDLEPVEVRLSEIKNKEYILLDFWYSNCGPCLQEMPNYIPLYEKYKDNGFEIVSISTDKTSKIQDWKDVIRERNFNWIHYLDENRYEADKLNIILFPTTFLINSKGEILEKDITSEELTHFLSDKLGTE